MVGLNVCSSRKSLILYMDNKLVGALGIMMMGSLRFAFADDDEAAADDDDLCRDEEDDEDGTAFRELEEDDEEGFCGCLEEDAFGSTFLLGSC